MISCLGIYSHGGMRMSVCIFYFAILFACTAHQTYIHTHTIACTMCHMCETLGPGSTFQERKKECERERPRTSKMLIPLCVFHFSFTRIFCSLCCFFHFHYALICSYVCVCVASSDFEYEFSTPLGISLVKKETHIRENYFAYEQQKHINTYVRILCLFSHIFYLLFNFLFHNLFPS